VRGPWSPLGSSILWSRGKLALRDDAWRLPDGTERAYPVLAVGACVAVLGFVEPDRVLLVRQFRHLARAAAWELPGGGALAGEAPEAAAQRELREEGGYRAERLAFLTRFWPSAAYLDEVAWCYVAHGLTPDPLPADEDEFFERSVVPVAEAVRMALDGEITESVSKVTLLQYALTHARR
jgi:ADP-ribose pyrophosphatase